MKTISEKITELKSLKAYTFISEEDIEDVGGRGVVLKHNKTGAKVAVVVNEDDNKVFCISFRTPPKDSTGVPHIIEHSVLCGSENYMLKDPFIELAKGSLNTFLNAMTYPDKTMYPVASCNEKDLCNLMEVYMDAVFKPDMYRSPEIFKQEGWHYELEDIDSELKINGIVYNEMKGAYSSPDNKLFEEVQQYLLQGTPYGYSSGGDPKCIPDLTYEDFLTFHKTHYHPSNSYIYLYGDMDFTARLEWIDKAYLSEFDMLSVDSEIKDCSTEPFARDILSKYSISEDESEAQKTYFTYSMMMDGETDLERNVAIRTLLTALVNQQGTPLKKRLLDSGLCKDVYADMDTSVKNPYIIFVAQGCDTDRKDEFISIVKEELLKACENGVDKNTLLANISRNEFAWREANYGYPKGLLYGISMMGAWLYDKKDIFAPIKMNSVYASVKEKIETEYFEQLIKDYMLENNRTLILTLAPEKGLATKEEEELKAKLAAHKASLSKEELEQIVADTKALKAYQEREENQEALAKLPMLERSDIKKETDSRDISELKIEDIPVVYNNVFSNGISYVNLAFDADGIDEEEMHYLQFVSKVFLSIDTEKKSYMELVNEMNMHTGGIPLNYRQMPVRNSDKGYKAVFSISPRMLVPKTKEALELIAEIITESKFEDTKRLKEILDLNIVRNEERINSSGDSVAMTRLFANVSPSGAFEEVTGGITQYEFYKKLADNYEESKEELSKKLSSVVKKIFTADRLMVAVTGGKDSLETLKAELPAFVNKLFKSEPAEKKSVELNVNKKNEGFRLSGQVQYVGTGFNFIEAGFEYTGAMRVLGNIVSNEYLWNNVRILGGAYGGYMVTRRYVGLIGMCSYRDPKLKETLEVYKGVADYLRNIDMDERTLTKFIIGTFSGVDRPLTPAMKADIYLSDYIYGITHEELQKERDEILNVTNEQIRAFAELFDKLAAADNICVLGSASAIDANKELFSEVRTLIQ